VSPDLNAGLHTLCYPVDPAALGGAVLYPLDAGFAAAWDVLASHAKAKAGRDAATPSYSAVATALTAATGSSPAATWPEPTLSTAPARSWPRPPRSTRGSWQPRSACSSG
jgi:hypothetical protein